MVNILLKNVRILDDPKKPATAPCDIAIKNGIITAIGKDLKPESGMEIFQAGNAWVSPGWLDIGAATCDPGFEHREDLFSAAAAGAAGGFTAIASQPNTLPAMHGKAEILYIKNKTAALPVSILPIGAVSQDCEGKDLAELYDMHSAGAVAFSDGAKPLQDAGLLLRALQYTQAFNGIIINQPHHKTIAAGGQMHEGRQSTMLGLKGIPVLAEEIMVQRDLSLLAYAGGRLHIHLLSSAKSVELIRKAKQSGLVLTASVAVANLYFTDDVMSGFDSNYKVTPPLRSAADRDALKAGLADGTIDCLCSNHQPWDTEAKNLEFPYAEFGMNGLETAFALSNTALRDTMSTEAIVGKWAFAPRRVLGLPPVNIREGNAANLTIFNPEEDWTPDAKTMRSKSHNTPLYGVKLKGKVNGIIHNNQVSWNN